MSRSSTRSLTRWILVLPIIMVGSMLYWSLAIGLGGMSLMLASALSAVSAVPGTAETGGTSGAITADIVDGMGGPSGSILVHLEESPDPEDVNAGYSAPAESSAFEDAAPAASAAPSPAPSTF